MKKIIFSLSFFLFLCLSLLAQQNHFIYIQADNKQPFYIKLNEKVYSSSATGYIILSKLVENNYNLTIGFPKNEWIEQKLNISVQKNDLGFLLKNFEEKGWGLVDMTTFQIVYNNIQSATSVVKAPEIKEIPKQIPREETKQIFKEQPVLTTNKVKDVKQETPSNQTQIVQSANKSIITKLFSSTSNTNIETVYLVKNNTVTDTVRVSIPINDNVEVVKESQPVYAKETIAPLDPSPQIKSEQKSVVEVKKQEEDINLVVKSSVNNTCKSLANEDDYKKLRKKMAAADSDNEMLFKAYSTFQKQCYTTEQIKTLSFLFLTEDGKYKFLDTAYTYIYDVQNFSKLVSLLTDEYYIKRFNAMLKN